MDLVGSIFLAAGVFVATNLDDLFVLVAFLAHPAWRMQDVLVGQAVGIGVLTAVSVGLALAAAVLPPGWVGLLGLVPIALGIGVWVGWDGADDDDPPATGASGARMVAIALLTIANGGDNIGVYTPVFAVSSQAEIGVFVGVFAGLTVVWCVAADHLVNHPACGGPIRTWGRRLLPWVLIGVGLATLVEAQVWRIALDR